MDVTVLVGACGGTDTADMQQKAVKAVGTTGELEDGSIFFIGYAFTLAGGLLLYILRSL